MRIEVTKDNSHRIIITASYAEKQQGLVDTMLCNWHELESGSFGFTGYENTYSAISKLTEQQQIDVAEAILDRRKDNQAEQGEQGSIKSLKKVMGA